MLKLSLFYNETIVEEWPLSEWANVSYIEIVNEKQNDEHFGKVSKWTKQMNEWWKESRNGERQNCFTQTTKDARSLKRHWTVLLRVWFLCRWRCLNIVTRAHDTNHSMRVQIERIWNETFRRENRSVSALWTFGEYGWDNIANMKCVCVCVYCLYCYDCCLSSRRKLKCKVCRALTSQQLLLSPFLRKR